MENGSSLCGISYSTPGVPDPQPSELSPTEWRESNRGDATACLPPELLGKIYEFGNILEVRSERHKTHFPLVVSQVSARWRTIALHTPTLWKDIFIQGNLITATELVDAYLERSRNCLLDVDLDLDNCMTAEYWEERIQCQLDRIVEHVGRWRYLAVHGTWRPSFLTFSARLHDAFAPSLESIVISWNVPEDPEDEDIDSCTNIFTGGAPCLSTLLINEMDLRLFMPPLTSITSFTLGHPCNGELLPFRVFRDALMSMTRLRQLFINMDNVSFLDYPTPIELPSLISLEIHVGNQMSSDIFDVLSILQSPGIDSLLLDEFCDIDTAPLVDFFGLGDASRSRTYPSLRSLELRDVHLATPEATRLFSSIPYLTDIRLTHSIWSHGRGEIREALTPLLSEEDILLPDLRSITLTSIIEGELSLLRAIVSNRISLGRPISCLTIPGGITIEQKHLEWLQANVQVVFFEHPIQVTWSSCSARGMHDFAYRER